MFFDNNKHSQTDNMHISQTQSAPIFYQLAFTRFKQHLVDVTFSFTADTDDPILWLPSWLPGSYLIREFSRHVTAIYYQVDDEGDALRANKISKNEWQLSGTKAGDSISVTYEVYCYDLSVRTAYVDNQRIYGNFSSLLVAISGQEINPVMVTLQVPNEFYKFKDSEKVKIACGLDYINSHEVSGQEFTLQANSYDELIDYPFEVSEQETFSFNIENEARQDLPHRFFISGHHATDLDRLKKDLQQICQCYVHWLGDTPFTHYTFMTFASGNDYGGLEHINSTSLVTPRDDLPTNMEQGEPSENYQRYLGLCSHEYFHAWWVKTVRPDVMIDVNLRTEVYTPLLWVFEGFTSYIDDFILQASGVISKESYLKLLAGQINRYNQTPGRALQSVAESSFDAWIKLYRPDENSTNAGVSYYNKGALVALCLDLLMLEHTHGKYRIFDVIKAFYERARQNNNKRFGMSDQNLSEVVCRFIEPSVWQTFYEKYIIGIEKIPVNQLLAEHGIRIDLEEKDNLQPWGMMVTENSQGLTITKINRDSVASEAGLSAKDVIIAIDGIKASKKQLTNVTNRMSRRIVNHHRRFGDRYNLSNSNHHKKITCHAFRRDELMEFEVPINTQLGRSANPTAGKIKLSFGETEKNKTALWLDGLA